MDTFVKIPDVAWFIIFVWVFIFGTLIIILIRGSKKINKLEMKIDSVLTFVENEILEKFEKEVEAKSKDDLCWILFKKITLIPRILK